MLVHDDEHMERLRRRKDGSAKRFVHEFDNFRDGGSEKFRYIAADWLRPSDGLDVTSLVSRHLKLLQAELLGKSTCKGTANHD